MNKKINITSILKNATSLSCIFRYYSINYPKKKFLFCKENDKWIGKTFGNMSLSISKITLTLMKKGVKKGDRVFLLSSNRIEWVEFDIAIMNAGGITVPSFVTNNNDDNNFIVKNSNPKILIIESEEILNKNMSFASKFDKSKIIIINESNKYLDYKNIISGVKKNFKIPKILRNDISTIIYTSGTSGNPKGVVLSHKSLLHNLRASLEIISEFKIGDERFLSFLPLSHSYERMAGLYFPLLINAEIYFCSSLDRLLSELKEIKPTIFSAVPRLYENIFKKIKSQSDKSKNLKKKILEFVFEYTKGKDKKLILRILGYIITRIFIKRAIKKVFGGKIKALVSGGAALSPEIGSFFYRVGFDLLQGYGQTEAAPLIACNTKKSNDPKTVGFPVKDVEIKISSENEILVKGENVMTGYWKNKNLTNKTIVKGWLHTGDLGFFDKLGRLVINGRKKDLIVTSGGDNISVQKIEGLLTQEVNISQAVVYGDNRPYLIALLVLENKIDYKSLSMIVNKINLKLNSVEKIRKFICLDKPLTYEDGFLTQTQKIKRANVFRSYSNKIKKLYKL